MAENRGQPVLAQLLDSGVYSDLKLVCHGEEFSVHKAVVCVQSSVLTAAVDGDFVVGCSPSKRAY